MHTRHWLFWDGECAYCRGWAQWVERHDVFGRFHVIAYQQAVHVLTADGQQYRAGCAVLFILQELGYGWAGWLRRKPFVWLVEWLYHCVTSHRKWLSGGCRCE